MKCVISSVPLIEAVPTEPQKLKRSRPVCRGVEGSANRRNWLSQRIETSTADATPMPVALGSRAASARTVWFAIVATCRAEGAVPRAHGQSCPIVGAHDDRQVPQWAGFGHRSAAVVLERAGVARGADQLHGLQRMFVLVGGLQFRRELNGPAAGMGMRPQTRYALGVGRQVAGCDAVIATAFVA
jgi:hypothetical protein